jgi:hypothetical protein
MKPGSVRSGVATLTNTGSPAIVSVEVEGIDAEPQLAAVLNLKIARQNDPDAVPYDGPLGGAGRIDLGTHQKNEATGWTLTLSLPDPVDPALAEKRLAAEFHWRARSP